MIADTSFLIDFLRRNKKAVEKAEELEDENRGYALGSHTVYELWVGVARSDAEQKEEILDIISSQIIQGLDQEAGLKAGKIQQKLLDEGDRIGHLDALIAGIARENSSRILTDNVDEFERITNLEVENY
jgi:predicted nucleic acid-binding protein